MNRHPAHTPNGAFIAVLNTVVKSTTTGTMHAIYDVIGWEDTIEELKRAFPNKTYITREEFYRIVPLPANVEYVYDLA